MAESRLAAVRRKLSVLHEDVAGPGLTDPFQLILWEQVAYLADDAKRREAFALLKKRVGLTPQKVARAKPAVLKQIAAAGGSIAADERAERMRVSAQRVLDEWDGRLEAVFDLPPDKAVRALTRFPMIGKPGAEKILLLGGGHPVLALDSNGLRVLLRLGYGHEGKGYDQTYRAVRAATLPEERHEPDWLAGLHHLLRAHGQGICRRTRPDCAHCPLSAGCHWYRDNRDD